MFDRRCLEWYVHSRERCGEAVHAWFLNKKPKNPSRSHEPQTLDEYFHLAITLTRVPPSVVWKSRVHISSTHRLMELPSLGARCCFDGCGLHGIECYVHDAMNDTMSFTHRCYNALKFMQTFCQFIAPFVGRPFGMERIWPAPQGMLTAPSTARTMGAHMPALAMHPMAMLATGSP